MANDNQGRLLGAAVAGLVLGPAVVTIFGSPPSLVPQALTITAIILALLGAAIATKGWRRVAASDRATLLALALYAAAAVQGAAVALARGNNKALIAGQFLSMVLLPLGAAAALGLQRQGNWRPFATGLVAAAAAGGLVQLIMTVPTAINGPPGFRLMLPNGGSFAGVAPLALFLAAALAGGGGRRARVLAWGAAAVMLSIILGSGIRSQWLVLPAGVATYVALVAGRARLLAPHDRGGRSGRPRPRRRRGPHDVVVAQAQAQPRARGSGLGRRRARRTDRFCVARRGPRRGPRRGRADVPGPGVRVPRRARRARVVGPRPDGSIRGCRRGGCGVPNGRRAAARRDTTRPRVRGPSEPRLHGLPTHGGGTLASGPGEVHGAAYGAGPPASGPGRRGRAGSVRPGASIAFRLREARAIASEIRRSAWLIQLLGHGLGARYAIDTLGYDSHGQVQRFNSPNYIHNFYLFLPFKLGLVGTVEVLAALGIWVWVAVAGARARPVGTWDRRYFAAAAASWITYILWSAAAPEILDFRMAAIWGMLAATTAAARKSADAPPTQP